MTFHLSSTNAHGNIANKIYDLPSASLAKTWLSARHKVFRLGKGKHHMVMHDDDREGNIMYFQEYKNGARTRSLFKDMLRILSRTSLRESSRFLFFPCTREIYDAYARIGLWFISFTYTRRKLQAARWTEQRSEQNYRERIRY